MPLTPFSRFFYSLKKETFVVGIVCASPRRVRFSVVFMARREWVTIHSGAWEV